MRYKESDKANKSETRNITTVAPTRTTANAAPQRKRYDEALKQAAVENWIKSGKPGTVIAAELGVSYPSLKEWKARYCGDAVPQRDTLEAENRALRREMARVSEQRDILKKTLGIFTEPSSNATKASKP
jgi:transposase